MQVHSKTNIYQSNSYPQESVKICSGAQIVAQSTLQKHIQDLAAFNSYLDDQLLRAKNNLSYTHKIEVLNFKEPDEDSEWYLWPLDISSYQLYIEKGADLNQLDSCNYTALSRVLNELESEEDFKTLQFLLDHGARKIIVEDLIAFERKNNAFKGRVFEALNVADIELEISSDEDDLKKQWSINGFLELTFFCNCIQTLKLLLKHRVINIHNLSLTHQNPSLYYLLYALIFQEIGLLENSSIVDMFDILINAGAQLEIDQNYYPLYLLFGLQEESDELLKRVLEQGVDINKVYPSCDMTALMLLTHYDEIDQVKRLIKLGADVGVTNLQGKTALDIAKECKAQEVQAFLEEINQ